MDTVFGGVLDADARNALSEVLMVDNDLWKQVSLKIFLTCLLVSLNNFVIFTFSSQVD